MVAGCGICGLDACIDAEVCHRNQLVVRDSRPASNEIVALRRLLDVCIQRWQVLDEIHEVEGSPRYNRWRDEYGALSIFIADGYTLLLLFYMDRDNMYEDLDREQPIHRAPARVLEQVRQAQRAGLPPPLLAAYPWEERQRGREADAVILHHVRHERFRRDEDEHLRVLAERRQDRDLRDRQDQSRIERVGQQLRRVVEVIAFGPFALPLEEDPMRRLMMFGELLHSAYLYISPFGRQILDEVRRDWNAAPPAVGLYLEIENFLGRVGTRAAGFFRLVGRQVSDYFAANVWQEEGVDGIIEEMRVRRIRQQDAAGGGQRENPTLSINALRRYMHRVAPLSDEDDDCSICFQPLNDPTCIIRVNDREEAAGPACILVMEGGTHNCDHPFHERCIREWLAINPTCPLCNSRGGTPHLVSLREGDPVHMGGGGARRPNQWRRNGPWVFIQDLDGLPAGDSRLPNARLVF